ncbi:MAG TPA: hypothetical protein VG013_32835, partial [Gemmataceae bacterium]|nr:hypothetical protein [Gemmataceae bacterium]
MKAGNRSARRPAWWVALCLVVAALPARADEKLILLDDAPALPGRFKVAADGGKLYFAGNKYHVFDARGRLIDQIGTPQASSPTDLLQLPDGWFIACDSYGQGHLALCRPDGTEARVLVRKGSDEKSLRADMTGWTSPRGAAVDAKRKRIFVLDTTMARAGRPDPDWSRIAVFDFDGKYQGDINRYDAAAKDKDDGRRTWYDDIAVDPGRQRVYVLGRRTHEVLAFTYDGKPAGKAPAQGNGEGQGGLAVFPDGRVAAANGRTIQLYSPDLKPLRSVPLPADVSPSAGVLDVETDATGKLYASVRDRSIAFIRWSTDLATAQVFGPRYQRIAVDFPDTAISAGKPFELKVRVIGRPRPVGGDQWQVSARPSDGTDLRWRPWPASYKEGVLQVSPPADMRGFHEVAVRFGQGPIAWGSRANDPYVQKTFALLPPGATRSVTVITSSGRRAFRAGESIPLLVVRRTLRGLMPPARQSPGSAGVRLTLEHRGITLASTALDVEQDVTVAVPPAVTRRLAPGRYLLKPAADGHESYALAVDIAPAQADSPMQRILYHEFDQAPATRSQPDLADNAERMAFIRDYCRAAAGLGFSRETDRLIGNLDKNGPAGWRRDRAPINLDQPGYAPADYYAVPTWGSNWEAEYYLDRAVAHGLHYDSQLLDHCAGVRFRDPWLERFDPILQRCAQWLGRYPSFYGFNYNDEMFFGGFASEWTAEDAAWMKQIAGEKFQGKPAADAKLYALRRMYDSFNAAARQANPAARLTATPMWQFPAVEGSYAPTIYRGLSESYSHFISEGYHLPWYPAHSVDFLRRPGLPLMGVFDNGFHGGDGDVYLKNVMQVVARGVQGTGVEHTRPFEDAAGASAYRLGNELAKMYGPVFAEAPPANEAAVLYSYTQDVTEHRSTMGTPHWERVYAIYGAGLMAGIPMSIVYEEDVTAGWLLAGAKPRVPMLFLAGQTQPLPTAVRAAVARYTAAGGRVFTDADSAAYPGATKLRLKTHAIKSALSEGYAGDTTFPLAQPVFEKLAAGLRTAAGQYRRFPADTDDPWVSKNQFDGGAVRYLMVASETSPYPWDAGTVWSLGTMYNKTYLPRSVALTFPAGKGVVYDVFERAQVRPAPAGKLAKLSVNLKTFPGRLYALAPASLAAPKVSAGLRGDRLDYRVQIAGDTGQAIPARVPLRIRLLNGRAAAVEIFRGTGPDGVFAGSMALPVTARRWTLEICELLGGNASALNVSSDQPLPELVTQRPDVEAQREAQIRELLKDSHGSLTLLTANDKMLSGPQKQALAAALQKHGIRLQIGTAAPVEVKPAVYLVAGYMEGLYAKGTRAGDLLAEAIDHGLFDFPVSATVPGRGRGFFTAVFAPRGYGEHCIALVGGDAGGLGQTVTAFVDWLGRPARAPGVDTPGSQPARARRSPQYSQTGTATGLASIPRLSDQVGVKLSAVTVAADGKHLVVTADGYLRNVALVEDQGTRAQVLRAARVGQAPAVGSSYISADGKRFGASGREVARFGQGFHLLDAGGRAPDIFAAFGDIGQQRNHFAVSSTGDTVLAPGTYGVVCWRRRGKAWKEAWALDFWKTFNRLDWPVSATAERVPQFHAFIPRGADHALILYGEFSNRGWITPDNPCEAWLAAVGLADGKERWRFKVPILKTLLLPTLHTSPDGSRLLLQLQLGAWGKETFRFFSVADGKALGSWEAWTAPQAVAVAGTIGRLACAFKERLLEVRRPDATLLYNRLWPDQPVSLAFGADGRALYVADDSGRLTSLDADGHEQWHVEIGCVVSLASHADRVYIAGWDGRLRCFSARGRSQWVLDCTPAMDEARPMAAAASALRSTRIVQAVRQPTTSADVPAGDNLLRSGKATLTVGGTPGWMSQGKLLVKARDLTNGKTDDFTTPWLHLNEVFWDAEAGRQVWAEIAFKTPTHLHALTVYENPRLPQSWPS